MSNLADDLELDLRNYGYCFYRTYLDDNGVLVRKRIDPTDVVATEGNEQHEHNRHPTRL